MDFCKGKCALTKYTRSSRTYRLLLSTGTYHLNRSHGSHAQGLKGKKNKKNLYVSYFLPTSPLPTFACSLSICYNLSPTACHVEKMCMDTFALLVHQAVHDHFSLADNLYPRIRAVENKGHVTQPPHTFCVLSRQEILEIHAWRI